MATYFNPYDSYLRQQAMATAQDPLAAWRSPVPPPSQYTNEDASEFSKGVALGAAGMEKDIYGAGKALADTIGWQGASDWAERRRAAKEREMQQLAPLDVPSYDQVTDFGTGWKYGTGILGTLVPSALAMMAGGGVGGLAGRGLGMALNAGRGVPAALAASRTSGLVGEAAGAFASSAAPQAGAIYEENPQAPGASLVGGALAGALDVVPYMRAMSSLRRAAAREAIPGGFGTELAKQIGTEAGTEGLQEVIAKGVSKYEDPNFNMLSEDAKRDYINSMIAGAIGGGVVGGGLDVANRVLRPRPQEEEQPPPPPFAAEPQPSPPDMFIPLSERPYVPSLITEFDPKYNPRTNQVELPTGKPYTVDNYDTQGRLVSSVTSRNPKRVTTDPAEAATRTTIPEAQQQAQQRAIEAGNMTLGRPAPQELSREVIDLLGQRAEQLDAEVRQLDKTMLDMDFEAKQMSRFGTVVNTEERKGPLQQQRAQKAQELMNVQLKLNEALQPRAPQSAAPGTGTTTTAFSDEVGSEQGSSTSTFEQREELLGKEKDRFGLQPFKIAPDKATAIQELMQRTGMTADEVANPLTSNAELAAFRQQQGLASDVAVPSGVISRLQKLQEADATSRYSLGAYGDAYERALKAEGKSPKAPDFQFQVVQRAQQILNDETPAAQREDVARRFIDFARFEKFDAKLKQKWYDQSKAYLNRHTSILRTPNELGADNEAQAFDFTEDEMSRPKGGKYPDVLLEDYKPGSGQDVDPRKLLVADQDGEQRVVDLVRLNEVMMRKTRNRYPDLTLPQRIERNVTLGLGSLIRSPKARILGESLKDISDDAVVYTSGSMKDGSYRELYWGDIKAASDPGRGLAGLADKLQQQGDSVQRVIQLLESMIELRRQLEREGIKVGEVLKAYNAKLAMIERAERAHSETMQVLSQAQLRLSALQREQEEKVRDGKTVTLEESAAVTKLLERLQQRREASAAARAKIDQLQSDPKFVQMQSIVERLAIPREFAYLGRLSYMSEAGLQAKLNYYQKRQEALYRGAQQRRDAAARYRARPQESYKYWNPWEDAVLQGEGIETAMDRAGYGDEGEYDYSRNPEDTKFLTSRQVKDINRLIAQYTKKFKNNVAWDLIELGFPRTDFEVDGEVEMSSADAVDYLEDVKAGFRDPPREFEDERVEVLESPARYEERAAVLKEKIGEFSARYPHIARLLDVSELKVSKEERANSARAAFNFLFTVSPKTREAVFKHVQNLIDLVDVSRLWKRRLDIDKEARAPRGVKSAEANLPSPLPGRPTTAQPTVASLTKLREPLVAAIVEAKARIAEAEQAPAAAKLPPRTAEMVKKFETKGVEQDPIKFAQAHVSFLEGQIAKLDRAIAQASNEPEPARVTKPELPAAPNASLTKKDRAKWAMANKFIGRGSPRSSTAKYAAALQSFANTGAYTANDVVFVSAEGNRAGRMPPDFAEIDRAIAAGATIITDRKGRTNEFGTRSGLYNVGEREVAQHLERSGYAETNGDGVWKPAASPADMGLADSGVADVVTAFNGVSDGQLAEARVVALQKLRTEAKAQVFGRLETLAMRIAKLVGLPEIKLMTPDELRQHYREKAAYATDKQAIAEEFLQKVSLTEEQRGTYGSYYGRLAGRDDVLQIWISPALKDQTAMISVLAHEIGHAIYRTHFKNANQDTRDQVLRAYESWVANVNGDTTVEEWIKSHPAGIQANLRNHLSSLEPLTKTLKESVRPMKYFTSEEEWIANQIARWFTEQEAPLSVIDKFFAGIAAAFKALFDAIRNNGYTTPSSIDDFMREVLNATPEGAELLRAAQQPSQTPPPPPGQQPPDPWGRYVEAAVRQAAEAIRAANATLRGMTTRDVMAILRGATVDPQASIVEWDAMRLAEMMKTFFMGPKLPDDVSDTRRRPSEEWNLLVRAAHSPGIMSQLHKHVADDSARKVLNDLDGTLAVGVMYMLHQRGLINVGPETLRKFNVFKGKAQEKWKAISGMIPDSEQLQTVMDALTTDRILNEQITENGLQWKLPKDARDTLIQNGLQYAAKHLEWARKNLWDPVMAPGIQRMLKSRNAIVRNVALAFSAPSYEGTSAPSFIEGLHSTWAKYNTALNDLMKPYAKDQEVIDDLGRYARNRELENDVRPEAVQLYKDIQAKILDPLFEEMKAQELVSEANRRADYWPWLFLPEKILKQEAEFRAFMENPRFEQAWQDLVRTYDQKRVRMLFKQWQNEGRRKEEFVRGIKLDVEAWHLALIDDAKAEVAATPTTPEVVRDMAFQHLSNSMGIEYVTEEVEAPHNPKMGFINTRELNFLYALADSDGKKFFADFLEPNALFTLHTYLRTGIKRMEFAKIMMAWGEKLDKRSFKKRVRTWDKSQVGIAEYQGLAEAMENFEDLMTQARNTGATDEEILLMRAYVNAMLGMRGIETKKALDAMFAKSPLPKRWKKAMQRGVVINPHLQNVMGWAAVYQNFRLLPLAALSSVVDPMGIGVRSGSMSTAIAGMYDGMRAIYDESKGNQNMLLSVAHTVGTIERHLMSELNIEQYIGSTTYFSQTQLKLNEALFKYNLMEKLTRFSRLAATSAAMSFLKFHTATPTPNSARYMAELSLLQGDVQLDVSGDLKLLTEAERRANPQDVARDDRVRTALLRFVEHSIVRPDASQRPFWMSDPHYMLAGQYRGFSFSFYERILKRVATELSEHGNAAPLVSLLWFVPVMMMSDALRDLIQHGTDGPPWKRGWSVWDHVQNSAVRAGFLGHYENLTKAVEYPSSVLGPTGAQLVDWSQSIPNASKDVLNAMPLSVLYKNWFKRGKQYGELDQGGHQEAWSAPQGAWGSGW